ncbi:MAG: GNAT family N-acetyltransferase [Solibacillus sp.]|uniref:GNAT family N-acetyltransferase n=1 Tax=Solibacillus sp. TaxID=1909654 RepID=UPI0033155D15
MRGYILNMYTTPESRGRGLAKHLVERLLAEAKGRNVHHIFLISSPMGKPLYKNIGFKENDIYMEYFIK